MGAAVPASWPSPPLAPASPSAAAHACAAELALPLTGTHRDRSPISWDYGSGRSADKIEEGRRLLREAAEYSGSEDVQVGCSTSVGLWSQHLQPAGMPRLPQLLCALPALCASVARPHPLRALHTLWIRMQFMQLLFSCA